METSNGVKNFLKILLLSSAVVLLAAGCSKPASQQVSQSANQQTQNQQPAQSATTTPPQSGRNAAPTDARPWFTQTVDGSKDTQPKTQFTPGQTAYDVLNATHQIQSTDYGSMGKFVASIDGVAADSKHFWEFFVNGKSSNLGASSYIIKPGDVIEWKLSAINNSGE